MKKISNRQSTSALTSQSTPKPEGMAKALSGRKLSQPPYTSQLLGKLHPPQRTGALGDMFNPNLAKDYLERQSIQRYSQITPEMRELAAGNKLAKGVLRALEHEGMPDHLTTEKYLSHFAYMGWDEAETANTIKMVNLHRVHLTKGRSGNKAVRSGRMKQPTPTPEPKATPLIDKAAKTIKELQEVADDYAALLELRRTNPDLVVKAEDDFKKKWDGLNPDDAAWFADQGTVTLDEMIAMVLTAEGGSIAETDKMIILLADRALNYTNAAKKSADKHSIDYSKLLTAKGLLDAYNGNDKDAKEAARLILNNIFGHDDSFFGARDTDYERGVEGARTEAEQIEAWLNLTQDPEKVSSGRGDLILEMARQVANPDQWDEENNKLVGSIGKVYTQANQALIPDVDSLNARLKSFGLDAVAVENVPGGYTVFLNFCQDLVRRKLGEGADDDAIKASLKQNGCK